MNGSLLPLLVLVAAGVAWQRREHALDRTGDARRALGALTIGVFAPALVVDVVLRTPLEVGLLAIPAAGLAAVLACALVLTAAMRVWGGALTAPQRGALVLATVFGNGMGMALPAVDSLTAGQLNHVPLAYDLTVTVPLVWTVGVLVAARLGGASARHGVAELARVPPFLALLAALAWKAGGLPAPAWMLDTAAFAGRAAVPLLAVMVGLSLRWPTRWPVPGWIAVALGTRVIVAPLAAAAVAGAMGVHGEALAVISVTAAAPSVIVGVALCDRYGLDSALFGAILTVTTAAYVLAAPTYLRAIAGLG